ncbi:Gluconate 2-dehydrogenase alpha chain [Roseomonas mucosa]|uniref:GMC family oxidoreductase n=1 Tax=Roseomonas mucosa TaxID=207340 RepID=A0A1S8D0F2_9PROT|nr:MULTISPECIES: GMC family oxidoreductase [Roseomonas]MBS5903389.1 GMC family oxidoreductase [Acetobacteraceae bacterium]ATR22174.1 GMC family oxidoreductase [Roseomonas sp. FDAARGOS_362]AWV21030.1 Gluconate 2-dehydrogenase alpha chain [Roseomonas mucosa]MCG7353583.1 GMC family oxidoreductase [Roseomonas mucosa]MCG7358888.1 GMC family oxidoreductase [Roseomonas mucosa]
MAIVKDAVDAVVVGLGWSGSIMSIELARAGLKVRALESGPERTNAGHLYPKPADQLAYSIRQKVFARPRQMATTVRHNTDEVALPTRTWGAFKPGNGVGGAGVHWTGVLIRPTPTDLKLKTFVDQAYKPGQLQEDLQIQDFPFTWEEMEPFMDHFDKVCGASGATGNLRGQIMEGGDPFEGPRSNPFPMPPLKDTLNNTMFAEAARKKGYHPFPNPSAAASGPHTNPYGVQIAPCNYCGFCSDYYCLNYSKASPQTTILDAARRLPNFSYEVNAHVLRVDLHDDRKTAKGVTYIDEQGQEVFQPASIVILSTFQYNNVRLMLLSGIGTPYDPHTGEGVVGRNYAFLSNGGTTLFYKDKHFNPFVAAGPTGQMINDFSPGNFDAAPYGFIGGAKLHSSQAGGAPIGASLPAGTPAWGAGWKKAMKDWYGHSMKVSISTTCMSYRGNYLDLDPTYKDPYGQPLLRITFDWKENELKLQRFLRERVLEITKELNPDSFTESFLKMDSHWDTRPYISTHNVGGAVAGETPVDSAINRYLQSWDVHNVFVPGGNAFPQNFQGNPTSMIGAMTYWSVKAITEQYLKNPGPLVQA